LSRPEANALPELLNNMMTGLISPPDALDCA
jgi:hypothetical protein